MAPAFDFYRKVCKLHDKILANPQQHLPQALEAMETAKMLPEPNAEMAASVAEQTTSKLEEKIIR